MNRHKLLHHLYKDNYERVVNSKILVVGAGGIGCEILKNLALIGVKSIELIDLDTIDVSNLNRQFLFHPEHVGQSKAVVAASAAMTFNPLINVKAYHANIKDHQFNVNFFSSFDCVLNALDNVDARRHVNRLCLAANVPLFDSGTTGYLGQVIPILKGFTSCYECFPKPAPKVYPICTIRSTPDKPVHCIVWAKEALKLIFGKASESMLFEDETATGEKSEYMHLLSFPSLESLSTSSSSSSSSSLSSSDSDMLLSFIKDLVIGLFHNEVKKRIDMNVYKTAKITPSPLSLTIIDEAFDRLKEILLGNTSSPSVGKGWDHSVWSVHDSIIEFALAFFSLLQNQDSRSSLGSLSFDKDDLWSMKFVSATSNIRSFIFNISLLSFHDAKGIAGNIIPAIATTNAIVSAIQVMQFIKFLVNFTKDEIFNISSEEERKKVEEKLLKLFPQIYCLRSPTRKGYFLQPSTSDRPIETCYVCNKSSLTLQVRKLYCLFISLMCLLLLLFFLLLSCPFSLIRLM
jgi:ubiquitin-like 1-activating enzyme E1 B